jgi:PAS domain S-box-containing protein
LSNRLHEPEKGTVSPGEAIFGRILGWTTYQAGNTSPWLRYGLAITSIIIAAILRLLLNALLGIPLLSSAPFLNMFAAIMITAWFGGLAPGLVATGFGSIVANYFFLEPGKGLVLPTLPDLSNIIIFLLEGVVISGLCEVFRRALRSRAIEVEERRQTQEELARERELYAITLASIGDAVISTDVTGRISFLNPVAQHLTGWNRSEAVGQELSRVFNIVDEEMRRPVESPVSKVLAQGNVVGLANHTLLINKSGGNIPIDDSGAPIKDATGKTIGVVLVFRDVTERKYQEQQQDFLVKASEILGSTLEREQTLQNIVQLAVPFLADWCSIDLLDGEKVRRVASAHSVPAKQDIVHTLHERFPYPPNRPHPLRDLLLSGKIQISPRITEADLAMMARGPEHLQTLKDLGLKSGMTIPLMIRGTAIGAFTLGITESDRNYNEQDLSLAQELARRASFALDNAGLFEETQHALAQRTEAVNFHRQLEEQLTALVEASDTLLSSLQINQVLPAIVNLARRLVAADAYGVWRFNAGTDDWRTLIASGLSDDYLQFSISSFESMTSIAEPIIAEDVEKIPGLANRLEKYREEGIRSILIAPLRIGGTDSGTIVFYFRQPHKFSQIEIRVATALANLAAIAIGNAELYEEQSVLRDQAETARQRLSFLSEASNVLASSLDYSQTLQKVAQLCVPALADWCTVHIVNSEGVPEQLALAHQDPAKVEWVLRLQNELKERYPYDPNAPDGMAAIIRSGESQIFPVITDEMLVKAAPDEEILKILRELGYSSGMSVPMKMRGEVIGILQFAATESGYHFDEQDLSLAQHLARRAAMAVDNARLYTEAQKAIAVREDFLSMAAHELKTPVTSLRGFAQLLVRQLDRNREIDPDRLRRSLETINQQSERLFRLIVRLLDLSKLEAGKLLLEPELTNLTPLITRIVDGFSTETDIHQLEIQAPETLQAIVDPLRIEQVITNLIDNAIKYSPEGGPVKIDLSQQPDQPNIRLVVKDHGIGILPVHRERIFEPFYQAQSRGFAGIGMGLYITRQIIELHGGKIELEFPDEGGTSFIVTLPHGIN